MAHWTEGFDWKNAYYFVCCGNGHETGPYKGIEEALEELGRVYYETGQAYLIEATHRFEVGNIWPDGRLMLSEIHDEEGNRLPYYAEWD